MGDAGTPARALGLARGPEFDLIRRFLHGAAERAEGVVVGPGDDCAVVAGEGIALSSDMSVEGVHFRREWLSAEETGWRAASAALSDLAAVAARPIGALVSLAVDEADYGARAEGVMAGVRAAVEAVGGVLLGGDLTRTRGPLVVDVTVVGDAPRPILRSGGAVGDGVWVTGLLGGSGLAVAELLAGRAPPAGARGRFARPTPRTAEAMWLAGRVPISAMIDISDGLAGDAAHLAAASGVAIVLERGAIPVHPDVLATCSALEQALAHALRGGEDYELCFLAPVAAVEQVRSAFEDELGVPLTRVGRVEEGAGLHRDEDGERVPLDLGGFQHFRGDP